MIADYHRWSDEEAKQFVYTYMKGTALESVIDIRLMGPPEPIPPGERLAATEGPIRMRGSTTE